MSGDLRKVRSGDPLRIPAGAYNAFIDAAQVARAIDADARRGLLASTGSGDLVWVRNDSGADLPRFGVLGIAGPIIDPGDGGNPDEFKRRTAVAGAAITAEAPFLGRFVVANEPIPAGRIGRAVIRGATPALVIVADEAHTHADTFADEQLLRSGFTGAARILWKEDGTGERPAILELGPADRDRFPAKLGQAHAIVGRTFGWLYDWEEVRLNADPGSPFFGQYAAVLDGLRSADGPDRRAFNRYEAHLSVAFAQDGQGTEGFADAGACLVPGVLENCPPPTAAVPMLQPVPEGVVVELRAERTVLGETRFVFDAMTPVEFTEMAVPGGWYG